MANVHMLIATLADGQFHSERSLEKKLAMTQQGLQKTLGCLPFYGLNLEARSGKGYRLTSALELLDKHKILKVLPTEICSKIKAFDIYPMIDSTNQYLLDKKNVHQHIVFSEYQLKGRGRHGQKWHSTFGAGINLSIGWQFNTLPVNFGILSLITGVAVIRALVQLKIKNITLKWPNDLYHKDQKLGGILLELLRKTDDSYTLIFGIGVNYRLQKNDFLAHNPIDLTKICQLLPKKNDLAANLILQIFQIIQEYQDMGYQSILSEWQRYDGFVGKKVCVNQNKKTITGHYLGIDEIGQLRLKTKDQKIHCVTEGSITL